MNSRSPRRDNSISQVSAHSYIPGYLIDTLLLYQVERANGTARIQALAEDRIFHRVIVFRAGLIVYAGPTIPTPDEFVVEIADWVRISAIDVVLKFATRRTSIQGAIRALVDNGLLEWPEVARAARIQASIVLGELLPTAGQVCFERGRSAFDLRYDGEPKGSTIYTLLSERQLHCSG